MCVCQTHFSVSIETVGVLFPWNDLSNAPTPHWVVWRQIIIQYKSTCGVLVWLLVFPSNEKPFHCIVDSIWVNNFFVCVQKRLIWTFFLLLLYVLSIRSFFCWRFHLFQCSIYIWWRCRLMNLRFCVCVWTFALRIQSSDCSCTFVSLPYFVCYKKKADFIIMHFGFLYIHIVIDSFNYSSLIQNDVLNDSLTHALLVSLMNLINYIVSLIFHCN